jgi:alkylated DNA nucleotide flippase Atl1
MVGAYSPPSSLFPCARRGSARSPGPRAGRPEHQQPGLVEPCEQLARGPRRSVGRRAGEANEICGEVAVVGGLIEADDKTFDSPSGAGRYIKGSATKGWSFWSLPDGRRLLDVRAVYTGTDPATATPSFDWSALHTILEVLPLPVGYWTTYANLADAVGTAAQPLGNHVATCQHCSNAHRILKSDSTIAPNFRWSDPRDERDPMEMLRAEGALINGHPDPARELSSNDLQTLIEQ